MNFHADSMPERVPERVSKPGPPDYIPGDRVERIAADSRPYRTDGPFLCFPYNSVYPAQVFINAIDED